MRLASDGTLYGTTSYIPPIEFQGKNIPSVSGTLFTVTMAGAETAPFAFGDSTISPLLKASDGHYYAVGLDDGTYGLGAVIQF